MTIEMVRQIPILLKEGKNRNDLAKHFNLHPRTIDYWIWRLKMAGVKLEIARGPKPLKLD